MNSLTFQISFRYFSFPVPKRNILTIKIKIISQLSIAFQAVSSTWSYRCLHMPVGWKALHCSCSGALQWVKFLPCMPALSTRHISKRTTSVSLNAQVSDLHAITSYLPATARTSRYTAQHFGYSTFKRAICRNDLPLPQNVPVAHELHWKAAFHDIKPKFFFP